MFDLDEKIAAVTGGAGVLCSAMCQELAARGAKVVVLDRMQEPAEALVTTIKTAGGEAMFIQCDVLDKDSMLAAAQATIDAYGQIDILINGAGGNKAEGTTMPGERSFFDLPADALQWVFNLNFIGTVLTTQAFGAIMAEQGTGVILNISSMASFRPLTRVVAYSAAKTAINNFTQWLAVYLAQEYSPNLRVNAMAPGFFMTGQNRYLLTDEATGELTERGQQIIDHTPMDRFGVPEDLLGTMLWLVSDASNFVTGTVIPIDGGFSAYSGV